MTGLGLGYDYFQILGLGLPPLEMCAKTLLISEILFCLDILLILWFMGDQIRLYILKHMKFGGHITATGKYIFPFIFPYWYHENKENYYYYYYYLRPCFTKAITQLFIFLYWCQGENENNNNNNNSDRALQRLNTTQFGTYFKKTLLLWQLTDTYNNIINRDQFSQKAGHMLLKEHGSTVGGRLLALLL